MTLSSLQKYSNSGNRVFTKQAMCARQYQVETKASGHDDALVSLQVGVAISQGKFKKTHVSTGVLFFVERSG